MAQSKKDRAEAAEKDLLETIDPIPVEDAEVKHRTRISVDFESFLAAGDAETSVVDSEVVVPEFILWDDGHWTIAENQENALVLRLAPRLTANVTAMFASYRHGLSITLLPAMFETLLHPHDVHAWRARIGDSSRPVPHTWLSRAVVGMAREYGFALEVDEPGKSGS